MALTGNNAFSATYDPNAVTVQLAGSPIEGFGTDEMIEISPLSEEKFTEHVGVAGEITRARNYEADHFEVTLTLKHSSPDLWKFDLLKYADEAAPFDAKVPAFAINEPGDGGFFVCEAAWVKNEPTWEMSDEPPEHPFILLCANGVPVRQTTSDPDLNKIASKINTPVDQLKKVLPY